MTEKLKIYTRDGNGFPAGSRTVLALGTFDGVHIAHASLLEMARELRERLSCDLVGAWCFFAPPLASLTGTEVPQLTATDEKVRKLLDFGLDFVAVADFNEFKDVSAEDFVNHVLCDQLGCAGAVCGFNHRFGKGGSGDASLLTSLLGEGNVISVSEISYGGETVSSTAIRRHITLGSIETANAMLGYPFALHAEVIQGKHLGRKLHFPTANMEFPMGSVIPKRGVYATVCKIDGKSYVGVSNVGIRPSVSDNHRVNCETYIIDFDRFIYGQKITVEFHKYLRDEQKFESLDDLKEQIKRDRDAAISYFS